MNNNNNNNNTILFFSVDDVVQHIVRVIFLNFTMVPFKVLKHFRPRFKITNIFTQFHCFCHFIKL